MKKIIDFFKRAFAVRVIIAGVEAVDEDHDKCHVLCTNRQCALHHPAAYICNSKSIFINSDGKCGTFIPADKKHGEFPI